MSSGPRACEMETKQLFIKHPSCQADESFGPIVYSCTILFGATQFGKITQNLYRFLRVPKVLEYPGLKSVGKKALILENTGKVPEVRRSIQEFYHVKCVVCSSKQKYFSFS